MAEAPKEYYVSAGETTEGPFDLTTLRAGIASGQFGSRYQVWDDAAQSWAPFSTLDPLLRPAAQPAEPAPTGRRTPVRVVRPPPVLLPGQPPLEGEVIGAKPHPFEAAAPRATPLSGAPLGSMVPRQSPTQRPPGASTFDEIEQAEETAQEEEERPKPAAVEQPAPPRRRNYSPQQAGANASRPFAPAPVRPLPEPEKAAKQPVTATPPTADPLRAAAPEALPWEAPVVGAQPRPAWPVAAVCLALCAAALIVLWLAGLVSFGFRQRGERERMANELAAARQKLVERQAVIKQLSADKQDYLDRFAAAQIAVRRMRISVFAATRRALDNGDRPSVDQRLFELDQLARLVPDDEGEAKIRAELTDRYFSGNPGAGSTPAP